MLNTHKPVVKLLSDNGAKLTVGDVGMFACTAAEQNNLDLLKEIVSHGGNVTQPKTNGSTALHLAVCEGNIQIVKFLLDQGADIIKGDENGWTARDLAEQQGHDDIKELFDSYHNRKVKIESAVSLPEEHRGVRFLGRYKSEPSIMAVNEDASFLASDGLWGRPPRPRRRTNNFDNSLFGIMSAAHTRDDSAGLTVEKASTRTYAARVTVSCPEKGDEAGKLLLLPHTFEELVEFGVKKYGIFPVKILSKDGAAIDDIELVRDGDRLTFVSDNTN